MRDTSSEYAQRRKHFFVERLDRYDPEEGCWQEAIIEDYRTPVLEQVCFRIDFPAWLQALSPRQRRIAQSLAEGHGTTDVAQKFGLSLARVSQLRRELSDNWRRFYGEEDEEERMELLAAA